MDTSPQAVATKPKRRYTVTDRARESRRASLVKAREAAKHAQRGYKRGPDENDAGYQARLDRQVKPWRANLLRAIVHNKANRSADYASNFATGHTAPDLDRSAEAAGESRADLHEHIERCREVLGQLAGVAKVESQESKVESQESVVQQSTVDGQKSKVESQESKVEGQRSNEVESQKSSPESKVRGPESLTQSLNDAMAQSAQSATDNRKPVTEHQQPVTGKLILALAYVLWRVLRVMRTQARWERLALAYRLRELACWRQRHPNLTAERLNRLRDDLYLTLSDVLGQSTRLRTLQKRFEGLWTALFDPARWAQVVELIRRTRSQGELDWRARLDRLAAQTLGLPFLSPSGAEGRRARHDAPVSLAVSDPQTTTQNPQMSKSGDLDHGVDARDPGQAGAPGVDRAADHGAGGHAEATALGGSGNGYDLDDPNDPDGWFAGGIWEGDAVTMTSRHPSDRALGKMVKAGILKDITSLDELRKLLEQALGCGEPGVGREQVAALAEALWTRLAGFGELVGTLEDLLKATLEYHAEGAGPGDDGIADCQLPIDDCPSNIPANLPEAAVANHQPETSNRQPAAPNRQSSIEDRQSAEPAADNRKPVTANRQSSIENRQSPEPATDNRKPDPTFDAILRSRLRATGSRSMMEDVWVPTRLDSPGASPLGGIREWFESADEVAPAATRLSQKIDVALYEIAVRHFGIRREFVEWRPELSLNQWSERRGRPEWDPRVVTVDGKVLLKVRGEEARELDH